MKLIGLLITVAGWLLALVGLGLTSSTGGRMAFALIGVALAITGILGFMNPAYVKDAVWKK